MRLRPAVSEVIWSSNGSTGFVLDAQDQALFKRYRDRTIFTIGGLPMVDTWGNQTLQAAFEVFKKQLHKAPRSKRKRKLM